MKINIEEIITSHKMNWECEDYSGTIRLPGEYGHNVEIEWDGDCPDDYEDMQEAIESAAFEAVAAKK